MTLLDHYLRNRSKWRRFKRLLFPSPAETRFMELLGAHILKPHIYRFRLINKNGFPLCIMLSRGKLLRDAGMKREWRIGKCYTDFGNDIGWVIEIDGGAFHDVVADFDREVYMRERLRGQGFDLRILRIPAYRIIHQPTTVRAQALQFLTS